MPVVDLSQIGLQGQQAYYDRMQTAAQTGLINANTKKQELENQSAERLGKLNELAAQRLQSVLHRQQSDTIDADGIGERMQSLASPMEAIADIYLTGGATETGIDLLKNASEIRKRENDMENDDVKANQDRLENIIKGSDIVGRWLGGAQTEDEWDIGLSEIENALKDGAFVMEPELFEQIKNVPFNPNVAAFFRDRAISAADKARLELQSDTNDRLERQALIESTQTAAKIRMQQARDDEAARHNRVIEKASGGKGAANLAPNSDELKSVKALLKNSVYKDIKTDEDPDFDAAADYVASQALLLVKQNKTLDWNTAVQRTIMEAERSGAFGVEGGQNWFERRLGIGQEESATFDGKGLTIDTAVPMPNSKAQMVKGRYYITSRGRAKWNGSSFVLAE